MSALIETHFRHRRHAWLIAAATKLSAGHAQTDLAVPRDSARTGIDA
ncbi:hypothetical protein KNE206_29670 [Kitasatospora sp. NE20-6]